MELVFCMPIFTQKKEGFVIIIALIVSVIVLTVGIGIISITLKDYLFSGVISESHKAFYAADSGLDCAFYYDIQGGFSTPPPFPSPPPVPPAPDPFPPTFSAGSITCGGRSLTPAVSCTQNGTVRSCKALFSTTSDQSAKPCFDVSVVYNLDHKGTTVTTDDKEWVTFQSRGWNTCDTTI